MPRSMEAPRDATRPREPPAAFCGTLVRGWYADLALGSFWPEAGWGGEALLLSTQAAFHPQNVTTMNNIQHILCAGTVLEST